MRDSIDEQIMAAIAALRTKSKLEAMLRQVRDVLRDEQSRAKELKKTLDREKADVSRLEGLGLTALFHTVLGSKKTQLEKERQEFLAAKLKYDDAAEAADQAMSAVVRLREQLDELEDAEQRYERLLEQKEKLIAGGGGERARKLADVSDQLARLSADRKELEEAIQAGDGARHALDRVQRELGTAANWGTWDMLGGGLVATMAKHSRIDAARREATIAQHHLRRFRQELADADQRLMVSLDIGSFAHFADYFFDGLIADWIVQSKIHNASQACQSALSAVRAAVDQCRHRLNETHDDYESLSETRRQLILPSP